MARERSPLVGSRTWTLDHLKLVDCGQVKDGLAAYQLALLSVRWTVLALRSTTPSTPHECLVVIGGSTSSTAVGVDSRGVMIIAPVTLTAVLPIIDVNADASHGA